jgi:hypothetical protein
MNRPMTVLLVVLPFLGCAGPDTADDGLSFSSEHEALRWIADRSEQLGLGKTQAITDEQGHIVRLVGFSVGDAEVLEQKRAQLLAELGGRSEAVEVAGKRFSFAKHETTKTTEQPLCSADLCTQEESYKTNYYFYRSVGSKTTVTAGGYELQRQTVYGTGTYECVDLPGPLPVTCNGYCTFSQDCPSGFTLESQVGYPSCTHTCSAQVRNVHLAVSFVPYAYYGSSGILVQSFPTQSATATGSSVEASASEWGFGTSSAIGDTVGLCGTHQTTGPRGTIVNAKSKWGTVPGGVCQ